MIFRVFIPFFVYFFMVVSCAFAQSNVDDSIVIFDLENLKTVVDEPKKEWSPETNENSRNGLTIQQVRQLQAQFMSCWDSPTNTTENREVLIQLKLNPDGEIVHVQAVNETLSQTLSAQRAVNAVSKCAPYDFLPSDKYDTWKDMVLRFKPEI